MIIDTKTLSEMYRLQTALYETRVALFRAIQIERSIKEIMEEAGEIDENCLYLIEEIRAHERVLKKHEELLP